MQSVCSPIAQCCCSIQNKQSKIHRSRGVPVSPHRYIEIYIHLYSNFTATQHPACGMMTSRASRGEDLLIWRSLEFFKGERVGFSPDCDQGRTRCNDARCMPWLTWVCWTFLDIIHTFGQFFTIANWLGLKTWQGNAHSVPHSGPTMGPTLSTLEQAHSLRGALSFSPGLPLHGALV